MPRKQHRIIVDTNLWISYLLSKRLKKLDILLAKKEIILLFSQELLDELVEVTQRPKFRKYFHPDDVSSLLHQLSLKAKLIAVSSEVTVCRDDKDNFLLSLAEDGKASHLLTGDNDLLVIGKYKQTKIVTAEQYLKGI